MIKSYVLLIALCVSLFTSQTHAQSLELLNPVAIVSQTLEEVGPLGEMVADWHVQNISNNTLSVRCSRNVMQEVSGSENYFCWGVCFTATTDVSPVQIAQSMPGGSVNDTFYAHYRPNGNVGQTTVEYCFFDNGNSEDRICQLVTYCADMEECVVGIRETASHQPGLTIAPSLLSGIGKVVYSLPEGMRSAEIEIFSASGQIVQRAVVTGQNGMILLNGQDFSNGVYLVRLKAQGQLLGFSRLVVSH